MSVTFKSDRIVTPNGEISYLDLTAKTGEFALPVKTKKKLPAGEHIVIQPDEEVNVETIDATGATLELKTGATVIAVDPTKVPVQSKLPLTQKVRYRLNPGETVIVNEGEEFTCCKLEVPEGSTFVSKSGSLVYIKH